MANDTIFVEKRSGEKSGPFKAVVGDEETIVFD